MGIWRFVCSLLYILLVLRIFSIDNPYGQEKKESKNICQTGYVDLFKNIAAKDLELLVRQDNRELFYVTPKGESLLHILARRDDLTYHELRNLIGALIKVGLPVDKRDAKGNTPLHVAAKEMNLIAFKALLRHHAKQTIRNNHGKTALDVMPTDKNCHDRDINALFAAVVDKYCLAQASTLRRLIIKHDKARLCRDIKKYETLINHAEKTPSGGYEAPLVTAIQYLCSPAQRKKYARGLAIIDLLINHGASCHQVACTADPIALAAMKGHSVVVKKLVRKNLFIDRPHSFGQTSLQTLIDYISCTCQYEIPAWRKAGQLDSLHILLTNGADPNKVYPGMLRETPLHKAVLAESPAAALLLLWYGADVDAVDYRGRTPLFYVVDKRSHWIPVRERIAFLDGLLKAGADFSCVDGDGLSLRDVAMSNLDDQLIIDRISHAIA